ncbi:HNH endonuclease signature motif containing protein [Kitasatospora sp. NPDC005856]|uniref:HNH endonuclease n=1 Tax=Kitasatospora sp. NPDC005856 TaxID=3154566 RepID=UPI0033D459B6
MPTAPPSRCGDPACRELATNRGRCDEHQPPPWAGRTNKARRYRISSGRWRALKARVDRRDNGCCYRCGTEPTDDPDQPGFELDHITPVAEGGATEDLDNLGLICPPCHQAKSKAEAARGNQRRLQRRRHTT